MSSFGYSGSSNVPSCDAPESYSSSSKIFFFDPKEEAFLNPSNPFQVLEFEESEKLKSSLGMIFSPLYVIGFWSSVSFRGRLNIETAQSMIQLLDNAVIFCDPSCSGSTDALIIENLCLFVSAPLYIKHEFSDTTKMILRLWNLGCLPHTDRFVIQKILGSDMYSVSMLFRSIKDEKIEHYVVSPENALEILESMATVDVYNQNGWSISGYPLPQTE